MWPAEGGRLLSVCFRKWDVRMLLLSRELLSDGNPGQGLSPGSRPASAAAFPLGTAALGRRAHAGPAAAVPAEEGPEQGNSPQLQPVAAEA